MAECSERACNKLRERGRQWPRACPPRSIVRLAGVPPPLCSPHKGEAEGGAYRSPRVHRAHETGDRSGLTQVYPAQVRGPFRLQGVRPAFLRYSFAGDLANFTETVCHLPGHLIYRLHRVNDNSSRTVRSVKVSPETCPESLNPLNLIRDRTLAGSTLLVQTFRSCAAKVPSATPLNYSDTPICTLKRSTRLKRRKMLNGA